MRKKVIAGNWKMNKNLGESISLFKEIKIAVLNVPGKVDVILCPPYTSLETGANLLKESPVKLGAQNMHFEESGAFTGEISASMLKSVGCEYVILGHSERRTIFKETDEIINKKMKKALLNGLKPIFCVGETLEERENNITEKVVQTQITTGLSEIPENEMKNVIIAYEPVWAIGTGRNATKQQAEEVHVFIRNLVKNLYSVAISENITIQYGGSVKADNSKELLSMPNIDGALVGGACLKADSFVEIIKSAC
ncbi:MAG: triose-phosphate isomerase [Flavobacterium sp.]|nr:triose-phosphate isomerase [Flavobacterium sp.]